jgi:hypothetical protein
MPQHVEDGLIPLFDARSGQLLLVLLRGLMSSPHLRVGSKQSCVFGDELPATIS